MPPALATLLATAPAAPLPDPTSPQAIGWLMLTLAALVAAANQGMALIGKLRAAPAPGDITEDRVKAIERRMHTIELKMENHMGAMSSQFKAISDTLTNMQSDWSYAIGRIDGRHESDH
jgi:hypothetical protein